MFGPTLPLASALTSAAPPLTTYPADRACRPPGGNPNARSAPEGCLPRGLAPQRWGLGTPEPKRRTHRAAPLPPGVVGALPVIQGGKRTGPSEPPATFEGPLRQNARALSPARQHPHLGPPLRSQHSRRIRLGGLLGANPNPRSAPEGPLLRSLARQRRGLGAPEPQRWTHRAAPALTWDARGTASHSGLETGSAVRAHGDIRRPPAPKRLGLLYRSPAPYLARPPLAAQVADRAYRPPGANPNTRSAPEGPLPRGRATQRRGLGTPEPQRRTHPATPLSSRPLGALQVIQGGKTGRAL